ncbi:MAG: hypothetical protein AAF687_05555 [Pseudomonadota bacterium]
MRFLTLVIAAPLLIAASDKAETPATEAPTPREQTEELPRQDLATTDLEAVEIGNVLRDFHTCRDRISKVREEAGQTPLLNREPASPDKPLAIYAVDRRVDGCNVMVMKGDPSDIRPLPKPAEGPMRLMPADEDED